MQKWEYCVATSEEEMAKNENTSKGLKGFLSVIFTPSVWVTNWNGHKFDDTATMLNAAGQQGWELVTRNDLYESTNYLGGNEHPITEIKRHMIQFIFKRPIV